MCTLQGLKKTWLGLWSKPLSRPCRTTPDKESWCDRWGWNWNQWSCWLPWTWRSDSAISYLHQNCGNVPCTRPPATDFITNNWIFLESLLARWWQKTFSEPVRSIPSALGKVTPLLKSLLETSKIRSDDLRNIKDMDLSKLYKYSLRVFLVQCRFVVWTTICLYYHQEWQHAMKLTSPKIGPSRCARFVFVLLCNTLKYSVIRCNTL